LPDGPHYCHRCGTALDVRRIEGRDRRYCPSCDRPVYRNPRPCAGVLVVDGDAALLVRRTEPPDAGSWSVPAGFLEADEPPMQAARRELTEETGLRIVGADPTLFDTQFVAHPEGGHVLVVVYLVGVSETDGPPRAGDDAGAVRFWSREALCEQPDRIESGYAPLIRDAIAANT